jgi:hypothetical protein
MEQTEQSLDMDATNKPLTKWKQEPSVRDLKKDITEAHTDHQDQISRVNEYLDNLYVTGSAKVNAPKGRSRMVPKLIRKQAEWRYAALSEPFLSTDDLFTAKPVTWADKEGAIQNQTVLNSQFNFDIDKVAFIDEYVRTGVDEGTIICKVGWEFDEEEYEAPVFEFEEAPESMQLHQEIAEIYGRNPAEYYAEVPEELRDAHDITKETGIPHVPVMIEGETQMKSRTLINRPTVEVCDYRNVIIDPTCKGNIDKASFVVFNFESSMAELEKDPKYSNLKQINVNNSSPLAEPDHGTENSTNFTFSDEARKKVVVYEYWGYWDIDGSGVVNPIVAAWVGDTLIRMEENPFPDKKIPFVTIPYLPKRRSIHGEPDGALLDDNQKVMGATLRGMIDIMGRSANGQMGMRKDALDAVNRRRWRNGEHYEYNAHVDPRQAMYMHTFPEIPNSAMLMMQSQNQEAESLTGVRSYSQGVSGQGLGDVAAGVRGALDAASKRELGILRRLSSGLCKIGRKIMSMNAEFLDEEEVVRITDDEFTVINRDKLAGHYDLQLDISTAEEDDNKAQQLAFMLQTLGPNEDPGMRKIILSDVARLRKMHKLAKKLQDYEPKPDPMEQRIKELEVMKLEKEIEEIESKIVENYAEAEVDRATAENKNSDTDKKNLDYVEQESGVTQARDLQKIGEQAESQMEMKREEFQMKEGAERKKELRKYLNAAED